MKERPILFSASMVRALLDGSKTQTRRVAKTEITMGRESILAPYRGRKYAPAYLLPEHAADAVACCPHGQPGDRLWVREAFAIVPRTAYACSNGVQQTLRPDDPYDHDAAIYREGWCRSTGGIRWRPSIHMPRWASRITLEITGVRVERLQDISEADAVAEGTERTITGDGWRRYCADREQEAAGLTPCATAAASYRSLWEQINGPGSWAANPWVWVVEFRRLECTA